MLVYLLAIFSVLFLSVPIAVKAISIFALVYFTTPVFKHDVLLLKDTSIIKLNCAANGKARVEFKNGKALQVKITSMQLVFGYFVILLLRDHQRMHNVVIAKDTSSQEQFHALRVYLRSYKRLR